jgi:hypothetical protein
MLQFRVLYVKTQAEVRTPATASFSRDDNSSWNVRNIRKTSNIRDVSSIIDGSNSKDDNKCMDARNIKDVINSRMIAIVGRQKYQDDSIVLAALTYVRQH